MYRVELYAAVRRSVYVEGLSERAAARRFGLARETVRKMLRYRRPSAAFSFTIRNRPSFATSQARSRSPPVIRRGSSSSP